MKKRIIISTFLIMICLLTGNCYARAGGGSGSGSSGGGGSSSSSSSPSYYHDHDHYYYGRRSYNPVKFDCFSRFIYRNDLWGICFSKKI